MRTSEIKPSEINSTLKLFFIFIKKHGNNSIAALTLLFFGAILAGLLELAGLIILYYLIRVLVNYETLSETHLIKKTFNNLGVYETQDVVIYLGLTITVIFVLKNLYVICYYYIQSLLLKKWKIQLSSELMTRYLKAPYEQLLSYDSATIIRNINNLVANVINGFMLSGLNLFSNILVATIILSALFFNYFLLTTIIGTLFVTSTLAQNLILRKKSIELGKEKNRLQTEQNKHIFQGIYSIKETKVYKKENFFLQNFKNSNLATVINDTKSELLGRAPTHITEIILILSIVVICSYVILENVNSPEISVATLGLLAAVSFRIAPIMNRIVSSVQSLNKNLSSIQKLFKEFEKLKISSHDSEESNDWFFKKTIAFEGVSYQYPRSNEVVLKNLNFSVERGEKLAIVGASGAGKSTLVSLLLGLLEPTKGRITVDEVDLKLKLREWRDHLGYVPQDVYISDDTLENNIAFGQTEDQLDKKAIKDAIAKSDLEALQKDISASQQMTLGENGKRISGGQKQRVGIARAIYRDCDVLVMDEPTSSLDVETEFKIMELISNQLMHRTIIFITHRLSSIVNFDKILFLSNGQISDFGSFNDLIEKNEDFNKLAKYAKLV